MVDTATQRTNMVESQVLTSDVTDRRILRAMRSLPRERFVPSNMAALAYMDEAVPLVSSGVARRWLLAPRLEAKLLQLADIGEEDCVLDVGSATGYSAAVLAGMARNIVALENDEQLAADAQRTLADLGIGNVEVVLGPLTAGWVGGSPYDAIVVQGAVTEAPESLFDQLKDGGRLVAVVNSDGVGKATIWRRLGRSVDAWAAFDASAPVVHGFERAPAFVF
jgi:protein-L-isoaspartate(D-aspartate) O-methyltransferase